jgi:hypothetical protein
MLGNDAPILTDDDTIGISLDLDRASDRAGLTEYLLLSKRTRQVLEIEADTAWKPSKRPA